MLKLFKCARDTFVRFRLLQPQLLNADFEMDWEEERSHRCLVIPESGAPYETDIGNIFTPPEWLTWFYHVPDEWDQPEVRDAWVDHDPRRVHSGQKGMLLFTFHRKHDAGYLQQVAVATGTRVRFSVWAHAWSNHIDGPHKDDPWWSEGPGFAPLNEQHEWTGERNWHHEGDTQDSNWVNFTFWAGIDPTGGTNPLSPDVVWGRGLHQYNQYVQEGPCVEAVAQADTVTVFVRSRTMWPFKHNDFYCDDTSFEVVEAPPPQPPSDKCRGHPRVQYERTIVLLPPGSSWLWSTALSPVVEEYRIGITCSADDAGIGDLDKRRVVAVNPHLWPGSQGLEEFFEEHYPGVEYRSVDTGLENVADDVAEILKETEPPPPPDSIAIDQCDPRWAGETFGKPGCGATYCNAGCYMACLAMALRFYEMDVDATPATVNVALLPDGFSDTSPCRPLWTAIESELGLAVSSPSSVDDELAAGYCAMAEVQPSALEHFVLCVEKVGDSYRMYDPIGGEEGILTDKYTGVESWRLLVPVEEPPPSPDDKVRIGLHAQGGATGMWQYYDATQSTVFKAFWWEAALDAAAHNPSIVFVGRHWIAHQEPYVFANDKEQAANEFIDLFRGSLETVAGQSPVPVYVSGLNEEIPTFDPNKLDHIVRFEMAFCDAVRAAHPNARPCTFAAAVGNPHESEFELLLPLAQKAQETEALFDYHCYWWANPNQSGLASWWPYHAGRWQEMDKVFVANGVYVKWFGGECGAVASADGNVLNPGAGWRHEDCYGEWQRYENDIVEFQQRIREWNSQNDNRFIGAVIFTTSGPGWQYFEIRQAEMEKLAQVL